MGLSDSRIEFSNRPTHGRPEISKTLYDFSSHDGYLNLFCYKIRIRYRFFFLFMIVSILIAILSLIGMIISLPFAINNHHHPCRSHSDLCKYATLIPVGVFILAGCCYFITMFIWILQETMMCTQMSRLKDFILNTFSVYCCCFGCILDDDTMKTKDPQCKCFWPITPKYNFVISELVDNDVHLKDMPYATEAYIHYFVFFSIIFFPFTLLLILIFGIPLGIYWIIIGLKKFIPWCFYGLVNSRCCLDPLIRCCHCFDVVDEEEKEPV